LDKLDKCLFVQCFVPAHLDCPGSLIAMPLIDDPFGIGSNWVIDKNVDVVPRREQGADVALKHEIRTVGALDGFAYVWIGGVDQLANLAADSLLPEGEGIDIGVNPWVGGVSL
jgi:hypothetical protein